MNKSFLNLKCFTGCLRFFKSCRYSVAHPFKYCTHSSAWVYLPQVLLMLLLHRLIFPSLQQLLCQRYSTLIKFFGLLVRVAEWSAGWTCNPALGQSLIRVPLWPLLDLFSVIPSSKPRPLLWMVNWLPPASWGFNPVMFYVEYLFLIIWVEC